MLWRTHLNMHPSGDSQATGPGTRVLDLCWRFEIERDFLGRTLESIDPGCGACAALREGHGHVYGSSEVHLGQEKRACD